MLDRLIAQRWFLPAAVALIVLVTVMLGVAANGWAERRDAADRATWTREYWERRAPAGCWLYALEQDVHDRARGKPVYHCEGGQ